jgi:hypothetical protein
LALIWLGFENKLKTARDIDAAVTKKFNLQKNQQAGQRLSG